MKTLRGELRWVYAVCFANAKSKLTLAFYGF